MTWIYVKSALVINYLGQGAWILSHRDLVSNSPGINPFFSVMPDWFLAPGIIISTAAAIIASQALITGSFTIISEAISLNFWPRVRIFFPTEIRGQMYIPMVNWFLFFACVFVVLFFKHSSNMEAAYGLAITITMLMTTLLLSFYMIKINRPKIMIAIFLFIYLIIEGSFLVANLHKFEYGGWFTLLLTGLLAFIMYTWYRGREIKKKFLVFVKIDKFAETLTDIHNDDSIPKFSTNLVYLTRADRRTEIESKILYSIINKQPKRADKYWFIHLNTVDEPKKLGYSVENLIPDVLYRIEFQVGFKIQPRINLFFRQVIEDLVEKQELDLVSNYHSLRKHHIIGDFRFVVIERIQNYDFDFQPIDQFFMDIYKFIKKIGISDQKAFGLDTSNVIVEKVPLESEEILTKFKKLNKIQRL
jgi:KUP system potassium uptake protein